MDDPVDSLVELEANLRDIERANHLFGGVGPVARIVRESGAQSVLDVGCGAADIPRALLRRARRWRRPLAITCLDRSDQMLAIAAKSSRGLTFVRADATALPFDDRSVDVAMCSLVLHHFAPEPAVRVLRELRRVSRLTPLVCDLRRSRFAYVAARAFSLVFTRNRLTRNDAPVSVLRSYTPGEACDLATAAGWRSPSVRVEPWFRMTLTDDDR